MRSHGLTYLTGTDLEDGKKKGEPFVLFLVQIGFVLYGILWFFGQILLLMVLTDIWFYFVHRAMHSKKLFRHTHKLHHLSTDPTPFATNSVHALEAVMDLGFIVIASFFIPLHPIALFITLSIAFI